MTILPQLVDGNSNTVRKVFERLTTSILEQIRNILCELNANASHKSIKKNNLACTSHHRPVQLALTALAEEILNILNTSSETCDHSQRLSTEDQAHAATSLDLCHEIIHALEKVYNDAASAWLDEAAKIGVNSALQGIAMRYQHDLLNYDLSRLLARAKPDVIFNSVNEKHQIAITA